MALPFSTSSSSSVMSSSPRSTASFILVYFLSAALIANPAPSRQITPLFTYLTVLSASAYSHSLNLASTPSMQKRSKFSVLPRRLASPTDTENFFSSLSLAAYGESRYSLKTSRSTFFPEMRRSSFVSEGPFTSEATPALSAPSE